MTSSPSSSWQQTATAKRNALTASIPPEWHIPSSLLPPTSQDAILDWSETSGWLTTSEAVVTRLSASDLVSRLASGSLRSEEVTIAFCKRAAVAHQLVNCLSETCFDRALATARDRDRHLDRTGRTVGPLHGLPVSLKDCFDVRGLDGCLGIVSRVGEAAENDAAVAEILEAAGAVLFVKTNVSTAMMMPESTNNLIGRTLNPWNRRTTAGGSSGGEAALVALRGSPLGVGTDIGGSLRIPAACCAVFTLRPSSGRFPVRGTRSGLPGQEAVASVNGPMARNLADLDLYCRAVVGAEPWLRDPACVPLPWRAVPLPPRLRIAVLWHDGIVRPTPPVARALRITADRLLAAGHSVVDWDADHRTGLALLSRMFVADGGGAIREAIRRSGEPWPAQLQAYELAAAELGTGAMWRLHTERAEFRNRYLDRWNAAGIDAILCPTLAFVTVRHDRFRHVGYTGVFNVLDYSCLSLVTPLTVDKAIDRPDPSYEALGPACQQIHDDYDAALLHGMPISLQLVARRFEEEKLLAMGKLLLEAFAMEGRGASVQEPSNI
ncbi:Acetamidase [Ophiocordyceps camponoti-floridani]|uniref:amidase n=1 Tax=Ophiocordyceps camponoti-floridani TaxID=2030778 RepID=A0A8H4QBP4_9HYPO|nr:Acetamidase [Ophiocordyceps camponoti-floridani]